VAAPEETNLKEVLRRRLGACSKAIPSSERQALSAKARIILTEQPTWMSARSVLAYAPLPDELDLWTVLNDAFAAGKSVFLPKFDPKRGEYYACPLPRSTNDLAPGKFNIPEPQATPECEAPNRLDLALVPGVAFDLQGRRLGRGKGFYDRLLKTIQAKTCGVAYDHQLVDQIPVQPHDISVNCILTPTRWIEI
jgi:5-formyltetrahydrofolate cyclo-ligase